MEFKIGGLIHPDDCMRRLERHLLIFPGIKSITLDFDSERLHVQLTSDKTDGYGYNSPSPTDYARVGALIELIGYHVEWNVAGFDGIYQIYTNLERKKMTFVIDRKADVSVIIQSLSDAGYIAESADFSRNITFQLNNKVCKNMETSLTSYPLFFVYFNDQKLTKRRGNILRNSLLSCAGTLVDCVAISISSGTIQVRGEMTIKDIIQTLQQCEIFDYSTCTILKHEIISEELMDYLMKSLGILVKIPSNSVLNLQQLQYNAMYIPQLAIPNTQQQQQQQQYRTSPHQSDDRSSVASTSPRTQNPIKRSERDDFHTLQILPPRTNTNTNNNYANNYNNNISTLQLPSSATSLPGSSGAYEFLNITDFNFDQLGHTADTKTTFIVKGLTSVSRGMVLKRSLSKQTGVFLVHVSLLRGLVEVMHDTDVIGRTRLQAEIEGYRLRVAYTESEPAGRECRLHLLFQISFGGQKQMTSMAQSNTATSTSIFNQTVPMLHSIYYFQLQELILGQKPLLLSESGVLGQRWCDAQGQSIISQNQVRNRSLEDIIVKDNSLLLEVLCEDGVVEHRTILQTLQGRLPHFDVDLIDIRMSSTSSATSTNSSLQREITSLLGESEASQRNKKQLKLLSDIRYNITTIGILLLILILLFCMGEGKHSPWVIWGFDDRIRGILMFMIFLLCEIFSWPLFTSVTNGIRRSENIVLTIACALCLISSLCAGAIGKGEAMTFEMRKGVVYFISGVLCLVSGLAGLYVGIRCEISDGIRVNSNESIEQAIIVTSVTASSSANHKREISPLPGLSFRRSFDRNDNNNNNNNGQFMSRDHSFTGYDPSYNHERNPEMEQKYDPDNSNSNNSTNSSLVRGYYLSTQSAPYHSTVRNEGQLVTYPSNNTPTRVISPPVSHGSPRKTYGGGGGGGAGRSVFGNHPSAIPTLSGMPQSALMVPSVELQYETEVQESVISAALLQPGDQVKVFKGMRCPADGEIVSGSAEIDESFLTGINIPVLKRIGDDVCGSSLLCEGQIVMKVSSEYGHRSLFGQITYLTFQNDKKQRLLERDATKHNSMRFLMRIIFPIFLSIFLLMLIICTSWALVLEWKIMMSVDNFFDDIFEDRVIVFKLWRIVASLAIITPSNLSLAYYLPELLAMRVLAPILSINIRNARIFNQFRAITAVVFDKTGTLSEGRVEVKAIHRIIESDFINSVTTGYRDRSMTRSKQPDVLRADESNPVDDTNRIFSLKSFRNNQKVGNGIGSSSNNNMNTNNNSNNFASKSSRGQNKKEEASSSSRISESDRGFTNSPMSGKYSRAQEIPSGSHKGNGEDQDDGASSVGTVPSHGLALEHILWFAASALFKSSHYTAKAIVRFAFSKGVSELVEPDLILHQGQCGGVYCEIEGSVALVGGLDFVRECHVELSSRMSSDLTNMSIEAQAEGTMLVFVAIDGLLRAVMHLSDPMRKEAPAAVAALQNLGLQISMVTGDSSGAAAEVGMKLGLPPTSIVTSSLPSSKLRHVRKLQKDGYIVMFVGNGEDDAPALAQADLAVLVGSGGPLSSSSADVILHRADLMILMDILSLSRLIDKHQFVAFAVTILITVCSSLCLISFNDPMWPWELSLLLNSLGTAQVIFNFLRVGRSICEKRRKSYGGDNGDIATSTRSTSSSIFRLCEGWNCNFLNWCRRRPSRKRSSAVHPAGVDIFRSKNQNRFLSNSSIVTMTEDLTKTLQKDSSSTQEPLLRKQGQQQQQLQTRGTLGHGSIPAEIYLYDHQNIMCVDDKNNNNNNNLLAVNDWRSRKEPIELKEITRKSDMYTVNEEDGRKEEEEAEQKSIKIMKPAATRRGSSADKAFDESSSILKMKVDVELDKRKSYGAIEIEHESSDSLGVQPYLVQAMQYHDGVGDLDI